MPLGAVKWYDCRKGFGFIIDSSGSDVFVHFTCIEGDGYRRLYDKEQVEYEVAEGPKGLYATRVRRLNPEPPTKAAPGAGNPSAPARSRENKKI